MPLILATALPASPPEWGEARLRALCARWERLMAPWLSPGERAHCHRFAPRGAALRARASRLLVRLLAFRALPPTARLDRDAQGRPLVAGAPGWWVAFSHSGHAAFCLALAPGEVPHEEPGATRPALDAEALAAPFTPGSHDRAFPKDCVGACGVVLDGASPAWPLRRWLLAEALFKATGASASVWGRVAAFADEHAGERAGIFETQGTRLGWRFAALPGHMLCVTLPERVPSPLRTGWFAWQALS